MPVRDMRELPLIIDDNVQPENLRRPRRAVGEQRRWLPRAAGVCVRVRVRVRVVCVCVHVRVRVRVGREADRRSAGSACVEHRHDLKLVSVQWV